MAAVGEPQGITPAVHSFLKKIEDTRVPKSDINSFIMDYLVTEGYPQAAERFAREAKMQTNYDLDIKNQTISARVQIREAIHKGDMQTAIELINDLNPRLLDDDGALHFSLLRLQLIELIRKIPSCSDMTAVQEALEFATENLASRTSTNPQWLHEFERAMTLLLFKPEDWAKQLHFQQQQQGQQALAGASTTPASFSIRQNGTNSSSSQPTTSAQQPPFGALAELIDPKLRQKVAKDVNEAILRSQDRPAEAKLYRLVRTRAWAEKLARDSKKLDLPDKLDIGLNGEDSDQLSGNANINGEGQNGHFSNGTNGAAESGGPPEDTPMAEPEPAPRRERRSTTGGRGSARAEGDAALAQFTNI